MHFNDKCHVVMTEWQTVHENTSISTPASVVGDNLIEENMDVDDDQDDKKKKQIATSSSSRLANEFKDVDHRFLDQDLDHQMTKTNQVNNHRKQRRKSRFSDISPADLDRAKKLKSNNSMSLIQHSLVGHVHVKKWPHIISFVAKSGLVSFIHLFLFFSRKESVYLSYSLFSSSLICILL